MLADFVLLLHFLVAAFIVLGLVAVWVGALAGWRWIGNPWFRYGHLAAIAFVAGEALLGVACPLTVWEDALRGAGPQGKSFIGRWVSYFLYYDLPPWAFTALYVLFALAVATTLFWIPPRRRQA